MTEKPTYEALEKRIQELERDELNHIQTENALRENVQHYRAVLQDFPILICSYAPGGEITFVNDAYCKFFNKTADELIGFNFLSLVPEADREMVMKNILSLNPQSPMQSHEHRVIVPNEEIKWQQWINQAFFDVHGKAVSYHSIGQDVTKRKRAEAESRKHANFIQSLLNAVPTPVFFKDKTGKYLGCNRAFTELMGVTPNEIKGKTVQELWPSKHAEVYHRKDLELLQNPERQVYDFEVKDKDGIIRPVLFVKDVFRDENGKIAGLVGAFLDIKEHKQAEEALRKSEKRFRDLVGMLPVAVFETDQNFKLTFANSHAFELFGYGEEDLAKGIYSLDLITPEDREFAETNIAKRISGEDPKTIEYQALKKDGSIFPILLEASSIMNRGKFQGIRGIIVDIVDRKRQEEERLKISDQLRQAQKMESIGRLAGGVSHDLNNLLSPIIGYGELLLQDLDSTDSKREPVKQILGAGMRAKDLVHQLLAFSRKQTLEYKPASLNNVLINFEKLLRRTIREDIKIEIVAFPNSPIIMADIGQIEQVVMNLAVNAQDAMPEGGKLVLETGRVHLDATYAKAHPGTKPGPYAMLIVSDTGYGMDEETLEHLFEPFYSTKGDKGTGLGLATVYGIIKQHEGNIWVYSEKGMGTTFKIYLPLPHKSNFQFDSAEARLGELDGTETILIAEDNENVRILAHDILKRNGYKILLAKNGIAALKTLSSYGDSVHLLLTDVVMPEMNGKELFAQAVNQIPNLKVLYMSGYTDDIIVNHGVLEEGVPLIQKPFSANALSSKVRTILDEP